MIKAVAKKVLRAIAPQQYAALVSKRRDPFIHQYVKRHGWKVTRGPFAGMSYIHASVGSSLIPKLIGSYECELFGTIDHISKKAYDTVIDVGCAEGYYAVGMAMRLPGSPIIHAFDTDPLARHLCTSLAKKNQVADKVKISDFCDAERLQKTLQGKSLVICDCEGYEADLLRPDAAPKLAAADLLVELHDCFKPGLTPLILERFSTSHDIQLINTCERDEADYPEVAFLTKEQQQFALAEFRPLSMQWAFMTPKTEHQS